ncbi:MAG: HAD family hydrolase [Synechococcales cyanobacterium T60_A2020_003]|nr:HAD family hydrolase [Synechococcales cyanobacterium T60_A2020_003]
MKNRPKIIFFDAVGTLFGVRDSVGTVYRDIALIYGVDAPAEVINTAFFQAFKTAPAMAFPGVAEEDLPEREFSWWRAIAAQTFQQVGVLDQFENFDGFFANLYAHFATEKPWFIYPDVIPMLNHWRDRQVMLAVLSNFDSRLHSVLPQLGLADYFASVTISTETGAAKPDSKIFQIALEKHQCPPEAAWHIGDSYQQDYQGAKAAGIRGIWLRRDYGRIEDPNSAVESV